VLLFAVTALNIDKRISIADLFSDHFPILFSLTLKLLPAEGN